MKHRTDKIMVATVILCTLVNLPGTILGYPIPMGGFVIGAVVSGLMLIGVPRHWKKMEQMDRETAAVDAKITVLQERIMVMLRSNSRANPFLN